MSDPNVHERERVVVLEQRLLALERAIALQAMEYSRRLEELNHAHAQQVQAQATYIGREVYEGYVKEERSWREKVSTRLDILDGRSGGSSSSQRLLFLILPLLLSAVALIVAFLEG
jgi:hypothetical protein